MAIIINPSYDYGAKTRSKNLVGRTLTSASTQMTTTALALTFVDSTKTGKDAVAVTGITAANPGVVTSAAHGLVTGDYVLLDKVIGMIEVNNRVFSVTKVDVDNYSLKTIAGVAVNTSAFTAYTSGGTGWKRQYSGSDNVAAAPASSKTIKVDGMQSITFHVYNQDAATTATYQIYVNPKEDTPPDFSDTTFTADGWQTSGSAVAVTAGAWSGALTFLRQGASQWKWICVVGTSGTTSDDTVAIANVGE